MSRENFRWSERFFPVAQDRFQSFIPKYATTEVKITVRAIRASPRKKLIVINYIEPESFCRNFKAIEFKDACRSEEHKDREEH